MRYIILTALLILVAGGLAADTDTTFIGPKGGDTRRAPPMVFAAPGTLVLATTPRSPFIGPKGRDTRRAPPISAPAGATSAPAADNSPKPWYIGPKGGDTRREHA